MSISRISPPTLMYMTHPFYLPETSTYPNPCDRNQKSVGQALLLESPNSRLGPLRPSPGSARPVGQAISNMIRIINMSVPTPMYTTASFVRMNSYRTEALVPASPRLQTRRGPPNSPKKSTRADPRRWAIDTGTFASLRWPSWRLSLTRVHQWKGNK